MVFGVMRVTSRLSVVGVLTAALVGCGPTRVEPADPNSGLARAFVYESSDCTAAMTKALIDDPLARIWEPYEML